MAEAVVKNRKKFRRQEVERGLKVIEIIREKVKADDLEVEKDPVQVKIPVQKLIRMDVKTKLYQNIRRKIRKRKSKRRIKSKTSIKKFLKY